MTNEAGPNIVYSGLVLHLDAANSRSYPGTGTTWTDLTQNGNNGTLINNPTYLSSNNGYFTFNGTNNHISVADNASLDISGDKTLMCWVYLSSDTSCGIVGKSETTAFGMALGYGWNSNGFMALAWNSSNTPFVAKDASRDLNKWNFLVARQNGGTRYIDVYDSLGTRSSSNAAGTHTWNNNFPFMIGNANNGANSVPANTRIGTVLAYNRSLSDAEIAQNYNAFKGRYGL